MRLLEPAAELDQRFSTEGTSATAWSEALELLQKAEIFWLSTVRPDGRPHVTPLIAVWVDEALQFCTGPTEQKARNLHGNQHVVLTTGCNLIGEGLDVVVEGDAVRQRDDAKLQRIADAYVWKYGNDWLFTVRDGAFEHESGIALVFEIAPRKAFGFRKGEEFSQTRWLFDGDG
jgi:uncharacterized pyridoxamine 5'-phosphate oxidase family protein